MAKKSKVATVIVDNNKSRIIIHKKHLIWLRNYTKIRAKGYFFSPAYRNGQWDGFVRYISEVNGIFATGLLDMFLGLLDKENINYKIQDKRKLFKPLYEPTELGGLDARDYQLDAVSQTIHNLLRGIKFPRGILAESTNAGKSLIAAMIFASYAGKRKGIFLVNSKVLFEQAVSDFKKLLPGEVGYLSADKTDWKRINVCMVQTLGSRMKKDRKYKDFLSDTDIMIIDEGDEMIGRRDCKDALAYAHNASVRICLTGTALMNKDKNRNQSLVAYFGPIIHTITNRELVDKGVSAPPEIQVYMGNSWYRNDDNWQDEYQNGIIYNTRRHRKIWRLVGKFIKKNRIPIVILFKNHSHGYDMLENCPRDIKKKFKIELVHHKSENRRAILTRFNKGRTDILLSSMIIRRAVNLPRIVALFNAAGGDSQENVLQIFGRLLRSHESKSKVWMVDFWDIGKYLQKHSKHRVIYYKNQQFGVKEFYKKKLGTIKHK